MSRLIALGRFGRARVWLDECPVHARAARSWLRSGVLASGSERVLTTPLCVEVWVPRGGRAEYGLLGGAFTPNQIPGVTVEVTCDGAREERWDGSLGASIDDVRIGLIGEYAEPLLETLSARLTNRFPAGVLRLTCAAHGRAGSSARFFSQLAAVWTDLMRVDVRASPDEALASAIAEHIQW